MDEVRKQRRRRIERLAEQQGGVMTRRQAYDWGCTRWMVTAELRAARWVAVGHNLVSVRTGPLTAEAIAWTAVLSGGPRAYVDGASSLIVAGLRGFSEQRVRVTVPRGARVWRVSGVDIRQSRRWSREDLVAVGVPRSRNEVAAIHAGLWARTQKEAATVISMAVQQRLVTPEGLALELMRIKRDRRRAFLERLVLDLIGGSQAISELEMVALCRRRGLPQPSQQVVRKARDGSYFLDIYWQEWGVVVEIDGIHHAWAENIVADALRHNEIAMSGDLVLRLPLLGLRVDPERFLGQIEAALTSRGWMRPQRHTDRGL